MGALTDSRSIESDIADCHQAIYRATDPDTAMRHWVRLRGLLAQKTESDDLLFRRETSRGEFRSPGT